MLHSASKLTLTASQVLIFGVDKTPDFIALNVLRIYVDDKKSTAAFCGGYGVLNRPFLQGLSPEVYFKIVIVSYRLKTVGPAGNSS